MQIVGGVEVAAYCTESLRVEEGTTSGLGSGSVVGILCCCYCRAPLFIHSLCSSEQSGETLEQVSAVEDSRSRAHTLNHLITILCV